MKLAQLQEARYSGDHPVITKVEEIADKLESRIIDDEYGFEIDDKETVISVLDRKYERIVGHYEEDTPTWLIRTVDVGTHNNRIEALFHTTSDKTYLTTYIY